MTGEGGKPELAAIHGLLSTFSQQGLRADRARRPPVVDIEAVRPEFSWSTIAMHWFHPPKALLARAPESQRAELFFQIWTHKEAYFKGVAWGSIARQ